MRKCLALSVLLTMAVFASGAAAVDENRFGLYYDQAATIHEVDISANSQQALYLVLLNPVSDLGSVQMVGGFECSIVPASGDFLLGVTFHLDAINAYGAVDNLMVGYAQGLAVNSGGGTTLATLSVLTMGNNPEGYRLQPASPSSYPNTMAYLDLGSDVGLIVTATPVSGSHDRPVFTFGDYTVDENRHWGDVKLLYR
jgi:hypothetical protein